MNYIFYNELGQVTLIYNAEFITKEKADTMGNYILSELPADKQGFTTVLTVKGGVLEATYKKNPPTLSEKVESLDLDINDTLYPYVLDLDFQLTEMQSQLGIARNINLFKKLKIGGNDMTYKVFKREIIRGVMSREEATAKLNVFEKGGKLTKVEADELRELIEIYLA